MSQITREALLRAPVITGIDKVKATTVASYSWTKQRRNQIVVPGLPSIYMAPRMGTQLQKALNESVDENQERSPSRPMEPLLRAVRALQPDYDFTTLDIITDRNNLNKLIHFCDGEPNRFEMYADYVDGTVILTRLHTPTGPAAPDFGQSFEEACHGSSQPYSTHRRIITYKLGQVNMMVRFEVDCVVQLVADDDEVDDLTVAMQQQSLTDDSAWSVALQRGGGSLMTACGVVELTTKNSRYQSDMKYKRNFLQCFLGHASLLVIGLHERGRIVDTRAYTTAALQDLSFTAPSEFSSLLSRLHELLKLIITEVKKPGRSHLHLVHAEDDNYIVLQPAPERSNASVVPPGVSLKPSVPC